MEATVMIDMDTQKGRKLIDKLSHYSDCVRFITPKPEGKTYTVKEAFSGLRTRIKTYYE